MDREPRKEIEPAAIPVENRSNWRLAQGQVKMMFEAMSEKGCPDDVLDQLFSDGMGVSSINCPREKPTAVFNTQRGHEVWHRAASGYASRAGYNEKCYPKSYILRKREGVAWDANAGGARD